MRIRSITVRHWTCIDSLQLADLADGLVILHGPNRTGKSSLVQAIRSCLLDHQHDSSDHTVLDAVPWRSKANPHVSIEFEIGKDRYRISKTYGKGRFGEARLEQQTPTDWTVLARGKDASRKTRELIGAEQSVGGIFQMLWLNQQDFRLPQPKDLDPSLKKSLETVLGNLITGPDIDFKERLDRALERWFTATGKDRTGSPVVRLHAELERVRTASAEIERQFHEAETALGELEEANARQPALLRDLEQAGTQLGELQNQHRALDVQKARHDLALRNRDQAAELLARAEKQLRDWHADAERFRQAQKQSAASEATSQDAAERIRGARQQADQARAKLEEIDRAHEEQRRKRADCDDRQQLLHLVERRQATEQVLRQADEHARRIKELEPMLVGPEPPSEKEIEALRRNRAEASKLSAQLEAVEIRITVQAKKAVEVEAAVDDKRAKTVSLSRGKEQQWRVRQGAELTIGELAVVQIARGKDDAADLAERLAELDQQYEERLKAAKAKSLDALVERRHQRELLGQEIEQHKSALARLVPAGLPAQQTELARLKREEESLRGRCPALAEWTPNAAEVERLKSECAENETQLSREGQSARQAYAAAEQVLAKEQQRERELRVTSATQAAEVHSLSAKLAGQDQAVLTAAVEDARTKLADAQAKADQNALPKDYQELEARLQAAMHEQRQRALRVRENEDLLLRLQTQLGSAEGLHQRRIQADQTLADVERQFQRESLQARAHRHLQELFAEIQQGQVRGAIDPVNQRVMGWAKQLGLVDYRTLYFNGQLLPAGLESSLGPPGANVDLDQESLGTVEQLSLLIRLAVGGLLAKNEPTVALLDDPLAHADLAKHARMLEILQNAAAGDTHAGPLQILLFTCHAERFADVAEAQRIDLAARIQHGS